MFLCIFAVVLITSFRIEKRIGGVSFDLSDVPVHDQPNGPLAP
jgi:hypothetical protein